MDRGVTVTGSGSASGPRDECVLTVGAEVRRPTAAAALAGTAEVVARMRGILIESGLPAADLATSAVSLSPVYDQYPTVAGFTSDVRISATTRALDTVGALLTALVEAGGEAARVHEVAYRQSDPAQQFVTARELAWADALAKATQLAALAGRELGEVLAIDETVGRPAPPRPLRMAAMSDAAGSGAVPLDAGSGEVTVTLTVGWSLR